MDVLSNRTVEGRKTVTVLFCDLVAYTELAGRLDPEALRRVMLRFFDRAAVVIEGHGGTVEKFVGDEVMAVFGVPVVHEDDALRAVRAGLAVHECVAELDRQSDVRLEVRIGINTGEVVTGDPSAGHGFVSGDAVAVGKRLEQAAAPGEIVLGESTYRLVEHAVHATRLEPLRLKGKAEEAVAFRLESVDPGASAIPRRDDTRFVGQEEELARLHSAYREAASSGVRLVTVVGDSGIGKSRLARELLRWLEGRASVVVASCPPYGEGTTFSPIREAFRQAGRDEALLEGSSYEVFAATRRLFEELARDRPLVAVFDDVHWAEETLLDLIEHLAVRLASAPVLILCLARPELAERRPQWLARPEATLTLDALSDLHAHGLLEALDAPAAMRERIAELAEGNPLFIEQLAAFADEGGNVALSGSIRGVLHARLDRLDLEERAVLERAAVLGRSFSLDSVLQLIPPAERERAQARVFELVRRGLVRPDVAIADDGFRFRHALIREAVYEAMPKALRADLHETVAAQLDDAGAEPAVVGFHLEHTCLLRRELGLRDTELAKRCGRLLRLAAEETLSRTDSPATISLLERARALLPPDDPELPAVLTGLGVSRLNGGDLPGAESALVEAVEAAATHGLRAEELHARIELQFVRAFAQSTPVEESVALAREAIAELEPLGDELALARAWWLRSSGDIAACRWRARGEAIERALEHARRAHAGIEMVGTLAGLYAQALLYGPTRVDEAIARVEGLPDELGLDAPPLRSAVHTSLAGLLALRGDFEDARRMFRDATATYEEFGLRFRRATQAFVGAQIELLAGDVAAAERELRASSAAFDEIGAATSATTHRALLAEVVARLGRLEEAEELAQRVAVEAPVEDLLAQVLWRCALARIRAREGAAHEAVERAAEARRLLASAEFPQLAITTLTASAEAAGAAGERGEAERLLAEAARIAEAKGAAASVAQLEADRVAG
jgi:class 3 adenylate cyclase